MKKKILIYLLAISISFVFSSNVYASVERTFEGAI